ncbi:MAG TPA: molecular chaperone DnaJ [Allosphingosinicella sp.]|nr:molecular chaperone DnaJ [Allosphingosinicella sp.]
MPALILLVAAGLLAAWWTGRLKGFTYEDGIAAALFLLGVRFITTGRLLAGAALIAGAILWAAYRRPSRKPPAMPVEDARALLGLGPEADLAAIRAAHRRLIARVHPDAGGSAELANRVNVARDTLIAELNRRTPRAS